MPDRRSFLIGVGLTVIAGPAFSAPAFKPLFDGKSLDGWIPLGDANWTVKDGAISADNGKLGFLLSREDYRDFELRAEFWVSDDANSGIFLRCTDRTQITVDNGYEVNIWDQRPDQRYATGAIVNVAEVSPVPRAGGRWNLMEISAKGDVFGVILNGRTTVDAVRNGAHREGPIALQCSIGTVKFRKVDIRVV